MRIEKNLKEKLERPPQKFRQEEKYTIVYNDTIFSRSDNTLNSFPLYKRDDIKFQKVIKK